MEAIIGMGEQAPVFDERIHGITMRQTRLAHNFIEGIDPYLHGDEHMGVKLRDHQSPALRELQDYFRETEHDIDRRILWPSPPNFGKSTMAALAIREARIGEHQPDGSRPLRAMVLVPRDVARDQVVAGCRRFLPGVTVSGFVPSNGKHAIDRADVLVPTYHGIAGMKEEDWEYMMARTDLLILDEVHRGLGEQISERLKAAMDRYGPTTIALSATPDFSECRVATEILNIERTLAAMTPREAAETGVSNGVQLLALKSGSALNLSSTRARDGGIVSSDLAPLIADHPRNGLILNVMRDMANAGRRGIVQCVPGGGNAHAVLVARAAAEQMMVDPITGKERRMRVEAVGSHRSHSDAMVAKFKAGELDALTFSKYLVEALDDDNIRYVFAASPTASIVDMAQLVGRGGRLGNPRITKLFCFIDDMVSSSAKRLCTPFHVFGEDSFYQGQLIKALSTVVPRKYGRDRTAAGPSPTPPTPPAPVGNDSLKFEDAVPVDVPVEPPTTPPSAREWLVRDDEEVYEELSPEVRAAMRDIPPGTVLDELLIIKTALREAPEAYVRLIDLPAVVEGKVTREGVAYALRNRLGTDGQPLLVNVVGKGKGEGHLVGYVSPEGAVAVNERYVFSRKIARLAIHNFLQEQGWPTLSFDGFAALCKAADVQYGIYKREVRLDVDDTARLLRSIAEIPLADAAEGVHAADLAKALWMETSSDLLRIAKKVENNEYADAICTRRRGKQPGAYREVQFIRTAGAILLAQECLRLWPTRAALIGKSAEAIVAEIQQEYGEYMRESNLQPVLAASAIDVFIASYDTDRDEEPDTSAPEVLLVSSEPVRAKAASPLKILEDRGVRLSSYDQDWTLHAKCRNDPNPDRFVSVAAEDMTSALSTCKGCGVKGECLVRSLKMDSFGTAGNLRHKERLKLLPLLPQVEAWLQETKPGNK